MSPARTRTKENSAIAREVVITRRGSPGVLSLRKTTPTAPQRGEVLVEVAAAGVAFGDVMLREGWRREVKLPAVPGYDIAGTVISVGPGCELKAGDLVVAWTGGTGGYATHATLPAWAIVPYGGEVDPAAAVAVVLNYLTAYQLLHRVTSVGEGDVVLVHGGAGGVGTALLELARLTGVTAYATASRSKHETVRTLGGVPIDYRTTDFVSEVRRLAPTGVTAIYDPFGGASWARSRQLLAPGGTLVGYGFAAATRYGRRSLPAAVLALARTPWLNMLTLVRNSHAVAGYVITEILETRHDWYRADLSRLLALLGAGEINPIIAGRYPFELVAQAHRELGERPPIGKLVLEPRAATPSASQCA